MIKNTLLAAVLLLTGCSTVQIAHDQQSVTGDPKEIIRQVISEQIDNKVPRSTTVTAEYLEVDTTVIRRGKTPTRQRIATTITIYFNNLGTPILYRTGSGIYIVAIKNKDNQERYRVYTRQESQARLLMDALYAVTVN